MQQPNPPTSLETKGARTNIYIIWCHPSRVGQLLCGRSKFQSCALGNENSTHAQRARWVKSTKLYGSPLFYLMECLPVHNILVTGAEYISSIGYSNTTHLCMQAHYNLFIYFLCAQLMACAGQRSFTLHHSFLAVGSQLRDMQPHTRTGSFT